MKAYLAKNYGVKNTKKRKAQEIAQQEEDQPTLVDTIDALTSDQKIKVLKDIQRQQKEGTWEEKKLESFAETLLPAPTTYRDSKGRKIESKTFTESEKKPIPLKAKTLAVFDDDPELNKKLKEKIRWGDPFAPKQQVNAEKEFVGDIPPNRFNILPGPHWDGEDRSNGFERTWFEAQIAKNEFKEELYKWRVEDM